MPSEWVSEWKRKTRVERASLPGCRWHLSICLNLPDASWQLLAISPPKAIVMANELPNEWPRSREGEGDGEGDGDDEDGWNEGGEGDEVNIGNKVVKSVGLCLLEERAWRVCMHLVSARALSEVRTLCNLHWVLNGRMRGARWERREWRTEEMGCKCRWWGEVPLVVVLLVVW